MLNRVPFTVVELLIHLFAILRACQELRLLQYIHVLVHCVYSITITALKTSRRRINLITSIHIQPFTQLICPRVDIPTVVKEIFLFFTSSVLEHIVTESNRYAQECKGELFATWQPITVEELLAYMGFMTLMGTVQLLDHWKKNAIYHYIHPWQIGCHVNGLGNYTYSSTSQTTAA